MVAVVAEAVVVMVRLILELSSKCFYLGGFIMKVTTQD